VARVLVSTNDAADEELSDRLLEDSVVLMPQDETSSSDLCLLRCHILKCFRIYFSYQRNNVGASACLASS
jgi:hypothetical protein